MKIRQQIAHASGIPLGGIGTGTIEIRPDGLFHEWQIFNTGGWSPFSPDQPQKRPEPQDFVYILRAKDRDGRIWVRYLALNERLHDLYSFAWLRSVQAVEFEGQFPVARLKYVDDQLPVCIQAEMFAPFVPHDSRESGSPGFYTVFTVKNLSCEPIEVSILGCLRNCVGFDQEGRIPHNRLVLRDAQTVVWLGADNLKEGYPSTGDMAFSVSGGDVSYITGAYSCERPGVFFFTGSKYGHKVYSYIRRFRETGELPNLSPEFAPSLPEGFEAAGLSPEERRTFLNELVRHPLFFDKFERLKKPIPDLDTNEDRLIEFLDDAVHAFKELAEQRKPVWGDAALCSRNRLEPGERAESIFILAWHFPNHISPSGPRIGHMYENWFTDALAVNKHLAMNYWDLRDKTLALPNALYSSTMTPETVDAASAQLSTLTKCTWWTKAGHFGVWEGLGCCGFHTTDITYQGSFPILALFPDLQKIQMVHGAKFQRDDGRVHHFFTPDFDAVDDGFDRVDMNQQFVMLAARDYLWTEDRAYLEAVWPHILRAMDNTEKLDTDGDGLPDQETKRNTYDCWDMQGCPSYISSLWLGALKAAVLLADAMGDTVRKDQWQAVYDKGVKTFEKKLWNGDYYILWNDEKAGLSDECCMSDQISGDWFAAVCGWGSICNPDRIRRALTSILRYNFRPEVGLINASYPPGLPHRIATSGNLQQDATWTGIEYTVVSLLYEMGMVAEAETLLKDIDTRHLQAGRYWNHFECGDHYYRALSSWSVLISASGFKLDMTKGELTLAPAVSIDPYACPFVAPTFWGVHRRNGRRSEIEIKDGQVTLNTLVLPALSGAEDAPAVLNGEMVKANIDSSGRVTFDGGIGLKLGDVLVLGEYGF